MFLILAAKYPAPQPKCTQVGAIFQLPCFALRRNGE
jgi:hypothetical protein